MYCILQTDFESNEKVIDVFENKTEFVTATNAL